MNRPNIYIKKLVLQGIHYRYNLNIEFNEKLNVLHGQNGTGKTTLIHIIANIANRDFIRFAFLEFNSIEAYFSNSYYINIKQSKINDKIVITLTTSDGNSYSFTKQQAIDFINAQEEDTFFRYTPAEDIIENINQLTKESQITNLETSYFPAFRTMLEAWSSQKERRETRHNRRATSIKQATKFSREIFGQFLPKINFPSPIDIEENLREEIRDAQINIARYESSVFSNSFVKVFSALLNNQNSDLDAVKLLSEISELTGSNLGGKLGVFEENSNTYRELQNLVHRSYGPDKNLASSAAGALSVYRDALYERKEFQKNAFQDIDRYFEVINSFLDKKELSYELDRERRMPKVGLKFSDNTWSSIKVMSSGERQLLTMLYAVNKMSGNSIVLIDEPELSLHIDWQEELLKKMMAQIGQRQIITCTHSPAIAADFDEFMQEINPIFIDSSLEKNKNNEDEEDLF